MQIALGMILLSAKLFAGSASWIQDGGNWSDPSSWNPNTVPNSSSDVATFTNAAGTFAGGNVDSTFSIASLNFTTAVFFTLNNGTLNIYDSIIVNEATGGASCNTTISLQNDISIITAAQLACQSITGTGGIIKTGPDILSTSNVCTYSGTTFVNEGIFRAGFEDAFSHNSAIVLTNVSGVELNNQGLSNTILSLSGGGSLGGNVTFDDGAAGSLTLGDSNDTTYAGVISGRGEIIKRGSGTFTLTGINTYTEGTTVQAGQLAVNGSITGGITINSGATLKGTGTISGGGTINGTLSPGNSIGIITFNTADGDLTLSSSSVTQIELNSSSSSKIIHVGGGNIVLGGSVSLIQNNDGNYARSGQYTILSGAYTGEFAPSVSGALPGFLFNLSYGSDVIYLLYEVQSISTRGLSGNALKVADYLNENGNSTSLALLSGLTGSGLEAALDSISPSRNAFGSFTAAQTAFSFSSLVSAHLDGIRFAHEDSGKRDFTAALLVDAAKDVRQAMSKQKDRFSVWLSGFGEFAHLAALDQNPAFTFATGAALAGFDYRGLNKGLVGGSLGYARSHYYANQDAGSGNINFYLASVYGNVFAGNFYFSPALWGIFNQTDNQRNIAFPGFSAAAEADILAWELVPHLEVGYEWKHSWGKVIPFATVDWALLWQKGYTETGASPYNAVQRANDSSFLRSETGLKLCQQWEKSWGLFLLKEKASYVLEKPFSTGNVQASFVGMPSGFTVTAVDQILNLGAIGLDFLFAVGKDRSVTLDFEYEGEFGSQYGSNELILTISKRF
jgi:fibronectin-binding autotransporter adhesin